MTFVCSNLCLSASPTKPSGGSHKFRVHKLDFPTRSRLLRILSTENHFLLERAFLLSVSEQIYRCFITIPVIAINCQDKLNWYLSLCVRFQREMIVFNYTFIDLSIARRFHRILDGNFSDWLHEISGKFSFVCGFLLTERKTICALNFFCRISTWVASIGGFLTAKKIKKVLNFISGAERFVCWVTQLRVSIEAKKIQWMLKRLQSNFNLSLCVTLHANFSPTGFGCRRKHRADSIVVSLFQHQHSVIFSSHEILWIMSIKFYGFRGLIQFSTKN